MVKFCPRCGFKLDQEFKFCPECGFELVKLGNEEDDSKVISSKESISNQKKICDNCGEENEIENFICSGCGAKLPTIKGGKQSVNSEKPTYQNPHTVKVKSSVQSVNSKKNENQKRVSVETNQKKLNRIKFITITSVGLGVIFLVLIFTGALNSIIIPGNNNGANNTPSTNSGVNLNNLQKINALEAVIKNNPADTASILELAHLKNDSGLFEQAIVNYKQYLALVPKDVDARIDLGICYYNLQNYDAAINEMEQAIKYNPKHQIGYLNLGIVNLAAGKMDNSREWLKKAVDLDPNSDYGKRAQELLSSHSNQSNGGN